MKYDGVKNLDKNTKVLPPMNHKFQNTKDLFAKELLDNSIFQQSNNNTNMNIQETC